MKIVKTKGVQITVLTGTLSPDLEAELLEYLEYNCVFDHEWFGETIEFIFVKDSELKALNEILDGIKCVLGE